MTETQNCRDYYAHPTAVIDPDVSIGAGTRIWHFCHILSRSIVGERCVLGQNVMVGPDVRIGNGCKIQNNVAVYRGVTLEDDVFCGPSAVFTNVVNPRAFIDRSGEMRLTIVRKGASIGANATIVCGVTIGTYALIAAGAVVSRNVVDYALVAGVPARFRGWVSRAGEKLGPDLICPRTGERYAMNGGALQPVK